MEDFEKLFTDENIEKVKSTMKEILSLFEPFMDFLNKFEEVIKPFTDISEE